MEASRLLYEGSVPFPTYSPQRHSESVWKEADLFPQRQRDLEQQDLVQQEETVHPLLRDFRRQLEIFQEGGSKCLPRLLRSAHYSLMKQKIELLVSRLIEAVRINQSSLA